MFLHSGHYGANEGPFWLAALSFLGLGRVGRDRGQRRRRERGIKSGPPFSLSLLFWRSPQRPPYHFSSRWKFGPPPKKNHGENRGEQDPSLFCYKDKVHFLSTLFLYTTILAFAHGRNEDTASLDPMPSPPAHFSPRPFVGCVVDVCLCPPCLQIESLFGHDSHC